MKRSLIFANPYPHHCHFTILGLKNLRKYYIYSICPGWDLQVLRGLWNTHPPRFADSNLSNIYIAIGFSSIRLIAIILFLCYKIKILDEKKYHKSFYYIVTELACRLVKPSIIYTYHHYFSNLRDITHLEGTLWVNEQIIEPDPFDVNFDKQILSHVSSNITVSPFSCKSINSKNKSRFVQVAYGGDTVRFLNKNAHRKSNNKTITLDSNQFIIVARSNDKRKGIDLFYEALMRIDQDLWEHLKKDVSIYICGSVDVSWSRKFADIQNHSRQKIFIGQLPKEEYLQILRKASVFIMPSRREGMPPAALEACWQCIPCIISKECNLTMFKDNKHGYIVSSKNHIELLEAIKKMLSSHNLIRSFRANLLSDNNLYEWQGYINSLQFLDNVEI